MRPGTERLDDKGVGAPWGVYPLRYVGRERLRAIARARRPNPATNASAAANGVGRPNATRATYAPAAQAAAVIKISELTMTEGLPARTSRITPPTQAVITPVSAAEIEGKPRLSAVAEPTIAYAETPTASSQTIIRGVHQSSGVVQVNAATTRHSMIAVGLCTHVTGTPIRSSLIVLPPTPTITA